MSVGSIPRWTEKVLAGIPVGQNNHMTVMQFMKYRSKRMDTLFGRLSMRRRFHKRFICPTSNQIERASVYRETIRRSFRPALIQLIGNSQALRIGTNSCIVAS